MNLSFQRMESEVQAFFDRGRSLKTAEEKTISTPPQRSRLAPQGYPYSTSPGKAHTGLQRASHGPSPAP